MPQRLGDSGPCQARGVRYRGYVEWGLSQTVTVPEAVAGGAPFGHDEGGDNHENGAKP